MRGTSTYWARVMALPVIALAAVGMLALVGAGPASADGLGEGIVGSPHDGTVGGHTEEICRRCHVPHDHAVAAQNYLNGLLWNHDVSEANYTLYDNAWSDSIQGATGQPDGISKMCLGCHDGTVALGNWGGVHDAGFFIQQIEPAFQVPAFADNGGRDLRGTHPISIVYDNTADPGLADPAAVDMGNSGKIEDVLQDGKVQCSSCHDVHDSLGEAVPGTHLLRVTTKAPDPSGLCLTCHIK